MAQPVNGDLTRYYRLKVTWRAVAGLPNGEPLKSPPRVRSVEFTVQSRK